MQRIFYVDLQMCGGEHLPPDFDLEDFCEVLQGKLDGIEVIPTTEAGRHELNRTPALVPDSVFHEALGEYLHR